MKHLFIILSLGMAWQSSLAQLPPCSGSPAPSTVVKTDSLCNGTPVTLSLSATYSQTGISYQWQSRPALSSGSFTNIPGATAATFGTMAIGQPMAYSAVITCSNSGISFTASPATIYGLVCTGLNEKATDEDFLIYPVPANGTLHLVLPVGDEQAKIALYATDGKKLAVIAVPQPNRSWIINTEGLSAGTYLLEVVSEGRRLCRAVMIAP